MKKLFRFAVVFVFILSGSFTFADAPVVTGPLLDWGPAIAYNPVRREYLVVWSELTLTPPFFGPLKGRRVRYDGSYIGPPFTILDDGGVRPSIAYDPDKDEYCVAAEAWLKVEVRFIKGSTVRPFMSRSNSIFPKVVYNTLAKRHLITYVAVQENPSGSGQCDRALMAEDLGNWPFSIPELVEELPSGPCTEGLLYAIDYAPVVSAKFPKGRFLIAIGNPEFLKMLDEKGKPAAMTLNPNTGDSYDTVPFQNSKVGDPHGLHLAFGYRNGNPVFFMVWGDLALSFGSGGNYWGSGIMGGIVPADVDFYLTTQAVYNETLPISYVLEHYNLPATADQWRPQVAYNQATDKFVVVWRETPTDNAGNVVTVNHIRSNSLDGNSPFYPPPDNTVLSMDLETADPTGPVVAASTVYPQVLVVWEDQRNTATTNWDIFGTFMHPTTRVLSSDFEPFAGFLPSILLLLNEEDKKD